jgi:RNA polymerase sigma-70 factor, ECF subfamily
VPGADDKGRDRERLADLAAGRADALVELYDRHAVSLYRHALVLARDSADAEDLVQAVFVKLATAGAVLLGVREPASYLHRMLHMLWIDDRRRKTVGERATEIENIRGDQPGIEAIIDLMEALKALPPLEREAIVLHVTEGFSFREIGRMTGVSLFTAAGRYRQGIIRLRNLLGAKRGD